MKTICAIGILCVFVSISIYATTYTVEDLGVLPGFEDARATAMNNFGQIVGWCETTNNISHAFLWNHGQMVDLGTFGGSESLAEGINDSGEIVGAFIRDGKRRIFLLQNGTASDLGVADDFPHLGDGHNWRPGTSINNSRQVSARQLIGSGKRVSFLWTDGKEIYFGPANDGKSTCYALAINDNAQIVGGTLRGDSLESHPFLWEDGTIYELETLGGTNAAADAINNFGTIIGWSTLPGGTFTNAHAFVWKNGKIQDLGTLGGNHARAYGINNADQIVGYSSKTNEKDAAFLWENGRMMNLNDLVISNAGWRLKCGDAINNHGQIVTLAWKDGVSRAVLLSPVSQTSAVTNSRTVSISISTNAPAAVSSLKLNSFARLPNGDFRMSFAGAGTNRYFIEASTNLTTWVRLGPAQMKNGELEFVDTNATKFNLRFYRPVRDK